ncbi:ABC transporter ATP-binding protein [Alsobacter metallidurans]|uniref:ABC transporter ATP-binding protein n=2 Tax=Alsobacter metallidurans TaxID=340221 RepID=A0A917I8C8_9HYPH|nr:ABC transporter ATP-binding protein [Alsobacter metallidurans]
MHFKREKLARMAPDSSALHLTNDAPRPAAGRGRILDVHGLRVGFGGPAIVDGVDLAMEPGELLCLVGESGSGKSLTALSVMRLLPPGARLTADRFAFDGQDLASASEEAMNRLRGDRIAMVFQEPMTSLNPVMSVGDQMTEILEAHRGLGRKEAREVALAMLRRVKIPDPEARLDAYPHQLSGGMRQRVMIAMALICRPALLIADEPTTALDVTIQSQILHLLDELRAELGAAVLFITHNLALVAEIADRIAVMYAGRIVESGSRADLFADPQHPYTLSLLAALPREEDVGRPLTAIDGQPPAAGQMPTGCRFAPRCPFAVEKCRAAYPPLAELAPGHAVACWRAPLERNVA